MTRRIGVYSGTFDPLHEGHVAFSLGAIEACRLDKVILLPERNPRGKSGVGDFSKRVVEMGKMIVPFPALHVQTLKSERFTVQKTLPEVQRLFLNAELTLLVGSDVVHTFLYRWENLEMLLAQVSLAIGMRNTQTRDEVIDVLEQIENRYGRKVRYTIIDTAYSELASSDIRERQ